MHSLLDICIPLIHGPRFVVSPCSLHDCVVDMLLRVLRELPRNLLCCLPHVIFDDSNSKIILHPYDFLYMPLLNSDLNLRWRSRLNLLLLVRACGRVDFVRMGIAGDMVKACQCFRARNDLDGWHVDGMPEGDSPETMHNISISCKRKSNSST